MNNRPSIQKVPKVIFTHAIPQAGVPDHEVTQMIGKLSRTCKNLNTLFKPVLKEKKAIKAFFQAMIDDDRETVKKMLDEKPDLLLLEPQRLFPNLAIESKLTWQRFYVENALTMAVKRKQIEMIKLMIPYYDKIKDERAAEKAKQESLSAWTVYDAFINNYNEEKFIIPEKYTTYAQSLVDVLKVETFPNKKLSEKTTIKLAELFERLLPEKEVKLDDYVDVKLLLLAVCEAYFDNYHTFLNRDQRDAFCIRVIGFVNTLLSPENAKILCEGAGNVIEAMKEGKEIEISERSKKHQLRGGENFYRESRLSLVGQGSDFLCRINGGAEYKCDVLDVAQFYGLIAMLMSSECNKFSKLMQSHQNTRKFGA